MAEPLRIVSSEPLPALSIVKSEPLPGDEQPGVLASAWKGAKGAITGLGHAVTHPIEALGQWRDQSQALFDSTTKAAGEGDYEAAAVHGFNFLANVIPGLGAAMDEAASAKTPEEFKSKAAELVGGLLAAKGTGKVIENIPKVPAAARAVATEAKKPGTAPIAIGAGQIASAIPAALTLHPTGLVAAGGLAVRGASNISKGLAARAAAVVPETPALYDEIAKSLGGSKYDSMTAEGQATVQKIAQQYEQQQAQPVVKRTEFTGPKPTGPIDLGPPAPKGKTLQEDMQEHIAKMRKEQPLHIIESQPLQGSVEQSPGAAIPPSETIPPVAEPIPAQGETMLPQTEAKPASAEPETTPSAQPDLIPPQPAPEAPVVRPGSFALTPGEGTHLAMDLPEGTKPTAKDYQTQARKVWAGHMYTRLKLDKITPEAFGQMDMGEINKLAKNIGINPASPEKLALVMERYGNDFPGGSPPSSGTLPLDAGADLNQGPAGQAAALEDLPVSAAHGASHGPGIGAETEVLIPGSAKAFPARYELRELKDIRASHSGLSFQPNEKYTLLNDRDYTQPENQGKVVMGATRGLFKPQLHITDNPDATNGPPVVDSAGNVTGGNGRTMILERVYSSNPVGAKAYRDMLTQKAQQYGINPADVANMKEPVLVRHVRDEHLTDAQDAITDLNKTGTASLTPSERALADSRRVSQATLENIGRRLEAAGPEAKLADILAGGSGPEILTKLIDDGVISPQEQAAYVKDGQLTKDGVARIQKVVLGRFFRNPAQLDAIPAAITNKLQRLAAPLASIETMPGWRLTPTIHEAMDLLEEATAHSYKRPDLFLKQGSMVARDYSPQAVDLATHLQKMKSGDLVDIFNQYAEDGREAIRKNQEGPDLFGNLPETKQPDQAFRDALQAADQRIAQRVIEEKARREAAKQAAQ